MVARRDRVIQQLLKRYGTTFAEEIGINLTRNAPSPLFQLLCASMLYGARISARIATAASRALADSGWTTAATMAGSTWSQRTKVLNQSGYARYDESTSRRLGEMADILLEQYRGDLRRLRDAADRAPAAERNLLRQFKGMGDVSVDIFFREVQTLWPELYPFADRRALKAARQLDLGADARALAERVGRAELPRLLAALIRVDLASGYEELFAPDS
ncbi:MAG: hypothetical protein ACLQNU_09170 [Candidatus Dormibacteria bacterium]|jgi:hypothetical protein